MLRLLLPDLEEVFLMKSSDVLKLSSLLFVTMLTVNEATSSLLRRE